jgi:hypothetical protein
MPQSIYQAKAYIGETIGSWVDPDWPKMPVWNWAEGSWVQLNADIGKVDYGLKNLAYDRVLLDIHDHLNFEFLDYTLTVTGPGVTGVPILLPDNIDTTWITGLTAASTYTVNLVANLISGGTSLDSIQTFTTPANPTPMAVIDLTSPARTNSWIDLKWTTPSGSTAIKYKVYRGYYGGSTQYVKTVTGTSTRLTGLSEDRKYRYFVRGVNATDKEGPWSNELKWATGHSEIRRVGRNNSLVWNPSEWGSYRQDIQWRWSRPWGISPRNPHIYQGYWPGYNRYGASNPAQNPAAGNTRRYWGAVTYNGAAMRSAIDRLHGSGVANNLSVEGLWFKKLYRQRQPGKIDAQSMLWHLTNTNPFNSGQPPVYGNSWRTPMRAGTYITMYGLPASWGKHLLTNRINGGTWVNGLLLHRGDDQTNGYGAAGYGAWSGHNEIEPGYSDSWRKSDLRLVLKGSWNFVIRSYKGPYRW